MVAAPSAARTQCQSRRGRGRRPLAASCLVSREQWGGPTQRQCATQAGCSSDRQTKIRAAARGCRGDSQGVGGGAGEGLSPVACQTGPLPLFSPRACRCTRACARPLVRRHPADDETCTPPTELGGGVPRRPRTYFRQTACFRGSGGVRRGFWPLGPRGSGRPRTCPAAACAPQGTGAGVRPPQLHRRGGGWRSPPPVARGWPPGWRNGGRWRVPSRPPMVYVRTRKEVATTNQGAGLSPAAGGWVPHPAAAVLAGPMVQCVRQVGSSAPHVFRVSQASRHQAWHPLQVTRPSRHECQRFRAWPSVVVIFDGRATDLARRLVLAGGIYDPRHVVARRAVWHSDRLGGWTAFSGPFRPVRTVRTEQNDTLVQTGTLRQSPTKNAARVPGGGLRSGAYRVFASTFFLHISRITENAQSTAMQPHTMISRAGTRAEKKKSISRVSSCCFEKCSHP